MTQRDKSSTERSTAVSRIPSQRTLLTGNGAAAWGARLAGVDYIPAFPITPQTEIIEALGAWIDGGEMDARMVTLESEHSMITAAGAAAATGVRVFSATSSQGLLYGMEMIYTVAGWRAPFVLVNVSRGLSAPITLEPDHNDILAARDSGFLQIHCATCQEVLDSVLIAYRLAEDERVRLPVLVNMDGFYLSFTREPVAIPDQAQVQRYLPPFDPENIRFRASAPISQAVAVLGGGPYSYFRYETHLAATNGLAVYDQAADAFEQTFGRRHPAIEAYRMADAEWAFVMMGSFATKAKEAVDRLRAAGWRIGLVRPRLLRPFPTETIREVLSSRRGVAVIDQNLSVGMGGVLHAELSAALYGQPGAPPVLTSFIGGLGGRDISAEEFYEMAAVTRRAAEQGKVPSPRLLYTEDELREVRKLQAVAHVEREDLELARPGETEVNETAYRRLKDLPSTHLLGTGTPMCAGCGGLEALHEIYDILGDKTVFVNAAGCMTLLSVYPFTPFRGSWLYTAMASAPAGAQGIRDALDILIKKGRLSPDEDLEAVVLTGDGAAYGMGLSATSGAIERGLDFLYICYDNEGYGNTGQQYSAATPHGAITSTSKGPRGYPGYKKDLFAIWAANRPAYVATVVGAEPVDLARKVEKAKRIQGPRLLIALAPCPTGWDFDPKESVEIGKLAVKTGIWPLKEYVDGRVIHTKVPRQRVPVEEYLKRQGRFAHLFSPGRDEALLTEIQARVDAYWAAVAESPGPQEGA